MLRLRNDPGCLGFFVLITATGSSFFLFFFVLIMNSIAALLMLLNVTCALINKQTMVSVKGVSA